MKAKNKITIVLLFVMSLYAIHGLFALSDDRHHHHNITEYVNKLQISASCGDICDCNVVFHQVFLLPQNITLPDEIWINKFHNLDKETYAYKPYLKFYKPPIS